MTDRRFLGHILCIVVFSLLLVGCAELAKKRAGSAPRPTPKARSTALREGELIKLANVEWITIRGGNGLHAKVLYRESTPEKVRAIVAMINSTKEKRASTEEEIGSYLDSRVFSTVMIIGLRDERRVVVSPAYIVNKPGDGKVGARPYDDRFIISYENDNRYETVSSEEVPDYLINSNRWERDMPVVPTANHNRESYKIGDTVALSGDGCIADEVKIYLQHIRDNERYLIGRAQPRFGKWMWRARLQRELEDPDGEPIAIGSGEYVLDVDIGENVLGVARVTVP